MGEKDDMAARDNREFLDSYRRLEDAISHGTKLSATSVLSYENKLANDGDTESSEKLKVCRIMRNYMTHHVDGATFLSATPKMTAFIGKQADKVAALETQAGNVAKRVTVLTPSTSMRDAASAFASHGDAWLPYADKDGNVTGAASVSTIAIMCANGMRSSTSIGKSVVPADVPIVDSSAPATDVIGRDAIVVNGKTGTFKGITRAARTS